MPKVIDTSGRFMEHPSQTTKRDQIQGMLVVNLATPKAAGKLVAFVQQTELSFSCINKVEPIKFITS